MHFLKIFAAIGVMVCAVFAVMIVAKQPKAETQIVAAPQAPAAINAAANAELIDVTRSLVRRDVPLTVSSAMHLAQTKNFSEALHVLDQMSATEHHTYDYRFAKARILTWSGYYDQAAPLYDGLMAEFPHDADITVSVGYMHLFAGDLDKAETHFQDVIEHHPSYGDARMGLQRTIDARGLAN